MIGAIINVCCKPDESRDTFWRRKNALVSARIPTSAKWFLVWAKRVTTWNDHVNRNSLGACWGSIISQFCSFEDLSLRRSLNNTRLAVRTVAGFTSLRFHESVLRAKEGLEKDK